MSSEIYQNVPVLFTEALAQFSTKITHWYHVAIWSFFYRNTHIRFLRGHFETGPPFNKQSLRENVVSQPVGDYLETTGWNLRVAGSR